MILNDKQIIELCEQGMITPFEVQSVKRSTPVQIGGVEASHKVISYGASSFGYDIRLSGKDFQLFRHAALGFPNSGVTHPELDLYLAYEIVDPKNFYDGLLVKQQLHQRDNQQFFLMPPYSYALGVSLESFNIPHDIVAIALGKSTYARCGLIVNCTPVEPGWKGHLTLEFSNPTPLPLKLYANEGILQLLFFRGDRPNYVYEERSNKYQNQTEQIVTAR